MHPSQQASAIASTAFFDTNQVTTSENVSFPQVVQIANIEELPSASQEITPLAASQCLQELQFSVEREAVDDEFWSEFKKTLGEKSFNELFHSFLLTNWNPTKSYRYDLRQVQERITKSRNDTKEEASEREDNILHYDTLVKVFLCANLKLRAASLIYAIIDLDYLISKLNDAQTNRNKGELIRKRDCKVHCINSQYALLFAKVYLPYQAYLKKTDSRKTAIEIIALKKTISSLRNNLTRYQKGIDNKSIEEGLSFINECLLHLKHDQKIPYHVGRKSLLAKPALLFGSTGISQGQKNFQPRENKRQLIQPDTSALLYTAQQPSVLDNLSTQHDQPVAKRFRLLAPLPEQGQLSENENVSLSDALKNTVQYQNQNKLSGSTHANEIKLTSLLNKMIGKDVYFYYEVDIHDDEASDLVVSPEKYYRSLIMLSVLNAQALSLKIRMLAAESTKVKSKTEKNANRSKLREKFSAFINHHLTYEDNTAILLNKWANQKARAFPENYIRSNYFNNCSGIKIMTALLADLRKKYEEAIENFGEKILLEKYFEFINSSAAVNKIRDTYSLSQKRINQIIQSVLNISPAPSLTQEQLAAFKFQIDRPPVDNSFWQSLKDENLPASEFRCLYFRFILTSWKSLPNEIYQLDKAIKEARENHLDLQLRANLVEKHFQEKLKYQAFHLIHHILQATEACQRLNLFSHKQERKRIKHEMEVSLIKIKENYRRTSIIYSSYLTARRSLDSVDVKKLDSEIRTCQSYMRANAATDVEDTESHILLINKVIANIEEHEPSLHATSTMTIFKIISDYVNSSVCTASTSTSTSASAIDFESVAPQQLQFLPVLTVEELNQKEPSTKGLQLELLSTSKLEPTVVESSLYASTVKLKPEFSPPTTDILELQLDPLTSTEQSLIELPFSTLESQLEPFSNFETLKAQCSLPYEIHNAISFSPPLATSQQVEIGTQQHEQVLKPSVELEQEQMSEHQTLHVEEVNTLDFLNR